MASSAVGSNASPNIFAVNPNGYVTILPNGNIAPMWIPFYPTGNLPYENRSNKCDPEVIFKQSKVKEGNLEGYKCTECKDFYPMAELNQPDNATEFTSFVCYSCRKGLKTVFKEITGDSK